MSEQRPWHRLFGEYVRDFFKHMPVEVETEKDLSLKQQFLDVVIVRKEELSLNCRLPDGFEALGPHNLITFKSCHEALDGWALSELVGHYVNYRKQVSPSMQNLLPEADFRLYAVSVRFPQGLARLVELTPVQSGVYEVRHYTGALRVVVVHELPTEEQNDVLHMFAALPDLVRSATARYELRSKEATTLLLQLFERYRLESSTMPDAMDQFAKETIQRLLNTLPVEERFKGASFEQRLEGVPFEQRLEGVPFEQRLEGVPFEKRLEGVPFEKRLEGVPGEQRLEGMSMDDIMAALSPERRAAFLERLQKEGVRPKMEGQEPESGEHA